MKYLILAVFLAVVQASPPIPRQTTNSAANTRKNNQNQTQSKKTPPRFAPPDVGQNETETTNGTGREQANQNAGNPVAVSKLPPVTINNRRDWADWGTWFFTFLLALTALLQILLLWKTLKVTSKQADIAERQELQMVEAGKQTERIIAQMKDAEVRDLRAYVGVSKTLLSFKNPLQPKGMVEIKNFGKTPAYKVRHHMAITLGPHPLAIPFPNIPASPSASTFALYPDIKHTNSVNLKEPVPVGTPIGTIGHTVYVFGEITYEDAFGNEWWTKYRFIFGGPGGGMFYTDNGSTFGAMYTDSEGNDAA